ncbi:hypothetical protein BN14_06179 [Rhizoctonia solani AG-1 IB]|uniref:CHAT domain-containing protein n=1 Tax=Thanatephorus cucumeris (strain AG1-IB / isolate 7/3/14) TaxID=1108050 RepID=M5BY87_THACB|nr:hypothetical protein BN14_06179 [Rhizoctonia solani AG-1 IB]
MLTPDGHPDLSLRHFHRGTSHHDLYQHTNDLSHLDISLASFRKASQLITGPPRDVFDNALRWANLAFRHSHLCCIEAFHATIDLLPHFIWLGATTAQRYQDLSLAESVAVRAASAAIQSSEYSLALEWLEHTRCVVWNQTLTLRSPIDELASSHSALAARLQTTSERLHHASSDSSPSNSATHTPEYRHRLAREYTSLLAEARSLPGFEDFLQPKKADALIQAARNGPIAVINCHEERCDALLVLPGQASVTHLALSSFTEKKARHARSKIEALLKHKKLRKRGVKIKGEVPKPDPDVGPVLADLWNDVVKPVLECLGYLNNDRAEDPPHITWCPTGAMTFLPLHAAGDYTQTRSRVFDHVISSYTPTLTALLASTSTQLNRAPKVLAIGLPAAPGCLPLPGVVKELEDIKARTQGRAGYLELTDNQATAAAVLDAMEKSDWVHMACHAHQNVTDPTKSGFFLHGGTLDLATITQRSFRNKGLAFLSACQTAKGDEKLPDEAIHLASGMLMAGYSSVIGTMWSVVDEDAPFVADRVYEQLMKDGKIGNGEAGRALHEAVGGLREKVGEKEYARWVPYIHIGS